MGEDLRDVRIARERHGAGENLVEDAAKRVDVGPPVDVPTLDLFGRDVVDRPDEHAGGGHPVCLAGPFGKPEVGQVDVVAGVDQHVARLDVAMDEPTCVSGVQRISHLGDQPRSPFRGQWSALLQQRAEVDPRDEPHGDVEQIVVLSDLVDRDDVRMLDLGGQVRLPLKALPKHRIRCQLGHDHLERDDAVGPSLTRPVHEPHAPAPGDGLDPVSGELVSGPQLAHRMPRYGVLGKLSTGACRRGGQVRGNDRNHAPAARMGRARRCRLAVGSFWARGTRA